MDFNDRHIKREEDKVIGFIDIANNDSDPEALSCSDGDEKKDNISRCVSGINTSAASTSKQKSAVKKTAVPRKTSNQLVKKPKTEAASKRRKCVKKSDTKSASVQKLTLEIVIRNEGEVQVNNVTQSVGGGIKMRDVKVVAKGNPKLSKATKSPANREMEVEIKKRKMCNEIKTSANTHENFIKEEVCEEDDDEIKVVGSKIATENKKVNAESKKRKANDSVSPTIKKKRVSEESSSDVDPVVNSTDAASNFMKTENDQGTSEWNNEAFLRQNYQPCSETSKQEQTSGRLWKDEEVVSEMTNVSLFIARNIIKLLKEDCTIPFIARYRKEMTGDSSPEKLREIETAYENVKAVRKKVDNIIKALSKEKVDQRVIFDLLNAKTMNEVELLYAPFKPGTKKSLSERAKQLGLLLPAMQLLENKRNLRYLNLTSYVKPDQKGVSDGNEVLKGIQNIIADKIAKDRNILDFVRNHHAIPNVMITSCKSAVAEKNDKRANMEGKQTENFKFENYYNFNIPLKYIKPHQVMALNRGENLKVLTVKVNLPKSFTSDIFGKCRQQFVRSGPFDFETRNFLEACIKDAYDRLLEPHICRQIRSDLSKNADKESVTVFSANLKRLLLTPPVRGKTVIGIDPGFLHGCKLAVVASSGEVLQTDVIYPHKKGNRYIGEAEATLKKLVVNHVVELIALGNGTACRQTESWLSDLIKNSFFTPYDVKYCIVDESGVSIYSVTKEAEAELPNMDPNSRSAVAIARRLQDPLLEYVKIEPKHIGVGMYQHDVPKAMLETALDGVVCECVSFVGVDLNVCSEVILRKISGLNASKAKSIIQWKVQNGRFTNRQQLLEVKGLGPKSYEQCAGFVKILPQTSINPCNIATLLNISPGKSTKKSKKKAEVKPNPLDRTVIHPESYNLAENVLSELEADADEIGEPSLERKVKYFLRHTTVEHLAQKYDVPEPRMQLIIDAFKQPAEYDIRAEFETPLFKTDVMSLEDLKTDQILTGRVTNVTHFGAFVDIGVERSGLIHTSRMRNCQLNVNDRVSVKVLSIEIARQRIQLELCAKTS